MFQNVIRLEKTSNSETVSLPVWILEIFCWGDMKKNLIKGRSLESVWTVLKQSKNVYQVCLLLFCLSCNMGPQWHCIDSAKEIAWTIWRLYNGSTRVLHKIQRYRYKKCRNIHDTFYFISRIIYPLIYSTWLLIIIRNTISWVCGFIRG